MEATKIKSEELYNTIMGVESMAINTIIALFTENGIEEMNMGKYAVSFDANEGIKMRVTENNAPIDIFELDVKTLIKVLKDCEEFVEKR